MKRPLLAAFVLVGWPAMVAAQSTLLPPGVFAPLPTIGLPLPQIGLPLPPMGLPPLQDPPDIHRSSPARGSENRHRRGGGAPNFGSQQTFIYFVPAYGWDYASVVRDATPTPSYSEPSSKARERKPETGRLRLDVQPARLLQLFVDGYYVGTPDDYSGELEMEAGSHNIQIRAPGHETLEFDVQIPAQGSITYRGTLKAIEVEPAAMIPSVPAASPALPAPTTVYVIPGCYAGNVPPKDAGLPATCDQSATITLQP